MEIRIAAMTGRSVARFPRTLTNAMNITQAPHGVNLVVETERAIYIGRLGKPEGNRVKMHHAAVFPLPASEDPEALIRRTAKYGVPVEHQDLVFEVQGIRRVRKLGEVPKA
jgi:hypothetical protein